MDRATTAWTSYDGRETLVKDLEVRHLVNILNWIKHENEANGRSVYSADLYALLEAEAELRILLGFAKNCGIPRKLPTGEYTVINQTWWEKLVEDAKSLFHKHKIDAKHRKITVKR